MGYSRKKHKQEELKTYFLKSPAPLEFIFLTISTPGYTTNFVRSLGNSMPKAKTPKNSTLFFLGHPWKFNFYSTTGNSTYYFFDTPGNSISSTPAPCLDFFWNSTTRKPFKSNSWSDSKTLGEKELKLQP